MHYTFKNESDRWQTIHALRLAAGQYARDAVNTNAADSPRVHRAFTDQVITANRIADEIEQSE